MEGSKIETDRVDLFPSGVALTIAIECYESFVKTTTNGVIKLPWVELPQIAKDGWVLVVRRVEENVRREIMEQVVIQSSGILKHAYAKGFSAGKANTRKDTKIEKLKRLKKV